MVGNDVERSHEAAVSEIGRVKREGLETLDLRGYYFHSLNSLPEEIAGLRNLQVLRLDDLPINDLTPISRLSNLEKLTLSRTAVTELYQLRNLERLKILMANETAVSSLAGLEGLRSLQDLWLNEAPIKSIGPLESLKELRRIDLRGTDVSSLSPLYDKSKLLSLFLGRTDVVDLSPLSTILSLQTLSVSDCAVSQLHPLSNLLSLKVLDISGTRVIDLASISGLSNLRELNLARSGVSDLSPIADLLALVTLDFADTEVSNLAPIAELDNLERLVAERTFVSDLSPLSDHSALCHLLVSGARVRDLRPIKDLESLGSKGGPGFSFSATPATQEDSILEELAKIRDHEERAKKTLAYLATLPLWPEPPDGHTAVDPPDQDPGLPLVWGPEGFAFLAAKIDSDPVTEAALEDLRSLLDDLRRKGNQHDDLFRLAGEMQDRSAGPIADLKMVRLHLSYQKLRRLYQGREARTEGLDDETVSVLGAVLEIVPGVTMADPGVKVLIERQEADRARPSASDIVDAEDAVLAAVHADDAPFAPEVKDIAGAIRQPGFDDRLAATRGILSRNAAVVVLKYLGNVTVAGIIGNYAYTHMPEILALARTMGDDAFTWAQMVFASFKVEYEASVGILRETLTSGAIRPKRKLPKDVNEP